MKNTIKFIIEKRAIAKSTNGCRGVMLLFNKLSFYGEKFKNNEEGD